MNTPFSLKAVYKQMLHVLMPRSISYGSVDYASHESNFSSIKKIQSYFSAKCAQQLSTPVPVLFNGMELSSKQATVRKLLGVPNYKRVKAYHNNELATLIYQLDYCGLNARAFVQLLNGEILNCKYVIDLSTRNALPRIKKIIAQKYQLNQVELGNSFSITDTQGNKLIFEHELELSLVYVASKSQMPLKVNALLNSIETYRIKLNQEQYGKLAYAI
jgi:hypothetical protein